MVSSGCDSGGQGKIRDGWRTGRAGARKGGKGDKDGVEGKDADYLCVCACVRALYMEERWAW